MMLPSVTRAWALLWYFGIVVYGGCPEKCSVVVPVVETFGVVSWHQIFQRASYSLLLSTHNGRE